MTSYQASIRTPFAHLGIRVSDGRLTAIDFITAKNEISPRGDVAADICSQIRRYLQDPETPLSSNIACAPAGTAFQSRVWRELRTIPAGNVATYGELAGRLGTSARAVGNACRNNPIPVVIPCHRVVSSAGLGGYAGRAAGDMPKIKSWLLQHEGVVLG